MAYLSTSAFRKELYYVKPSTFIGVPEGYIPGTVWNKPGCYGGYYTKAQMKEIIEYADIILVMTVNPGFGGQTLIPECLDKVKELVDIRKTKNLSYLISVDGGVSEKTAKSVIDAGVDVAVSGSAFFSGSLTWSKYEKN